MLYLFLSIVCSVSVGILLKLVKRNGKLIFFQMIMWNYLFAGISCYLFYSPDVYSFQTRLPWEILLPLMILLPSVFLLQAYSVRYSGIVRTDIAQRLSLIISLSAAYFIFKEVFSALKSIGLFIGLISIFFILSKEKTEKMPNKWYYPIGVLTGFGVIDVLFKQLDLFKDLSYTTLLFIAFLGSFIVSVFIVFYQIFNKRQRFELKNIYWGAGLGLLNFGNILFYLQAHQVLKENPSTVFACMNLGVIVLGSIIGVVFFKEKMLKANYIGIAFALVSIIFITISQLLS